jgi:DNA repair protein RecO (recombination protein O)
MPTLQATGIVVRGNDWSETSRIATLFTKDHGRIRVLAKGGRRVNSAFEISLDLLNVCDVVFIHKSTGGMDLLTEARIADRFPALRTDLNALYAGYYLAELLADGTQDMDPHPELFEAAITTLRRLNSHGDWLDAVSQFELAWLRELGYTPRVDACAGCGEVSDFVLTNGRIALGLEAGGVLCGRCRTSARDVWSLSVPAFDALAGMLTGSSMAFAVRGELRPLLGQMICRTLGRRPRLMSYVETPGRAK